MYVLFSVDSNSSSKTYIWKDFRQNIQFYAFDLIDYSLIIHFLGSGSCYMIIKDENLLIMYK